MGRCRASNATVLQAHSEQSYFFLGATTLKAQSQRHSLPQERQRELTSKQGLSLSLSLSWALSMWRHDMLDHSGLVCLKSASLSLQCPKNSEEPICRDRWLRQPGMSRLFCAGRNPETQVVGSLLCESGMDAYSACNRCAYSDVLCISMQRRPMQTLLATSTVPYSQMQILSHKCHALAGGVGLTPFCRRLSSDGVCVCGFNCLRIRCQHL